MKKAIKDGLPTATQDEVEEKDIYYSSIDPEYWIYLINTLKVKDVRKKVFEHIRKKKSISSKNSYAQEEDYDKYGNLNRVSFKKKNQG